MLLTSVVLCTSVHTGIPEVRTRTLILGNAPPAVPTWVLRYLGILVPYLIAPRRVCCSTRRVSPRISIYALLIRPPTTNLNLTIPELEVQATIVSNTAMELQTGREDVVHPEVRAHINSLVSAVSNRDMAACSLSHCKS